LENLFGPFRVVVLGDDNDFGFVHLPCEPRRGARIDLAVPGREATENALIVWDVFHSCKPKPKPSDKPEFISSLMLVNLKQFEELTSDSEVDEPDLQRLRAWQVLQDVSRKTVPFRIY
jgi:hypothetical protein